MPTTQVQTFATDKYGDREEITDLYWFEEEGIHDWHGDGHNGSYRIEIVVDGVCVYDSHKR